MANQISLWENDINRVQLDDAVLFEYFPSTEAFEKAMAFVKKEDLHLWDDGKSKIIVKLNGTDSGRCFAFLAWTLGKEQVSWFIKVNK